jgi:hypothetical protein
MPGATPGGGGLRCEEWEALLVDALDGLLPAGQAAAFKAHSETCANCGDLLAHSGQGREWLGYLHTEPEVPAGLIGKILEKTVGAGGVPLPVIAAGQGAGAVAMASPWRRNFHETRLLMTIAMAFFSITLVLNLTGVKPGNIRLADLRPSQIGSTLSRGFFTARGSVVRYYDNLRFVYQLQSRMRELRRDVESTPQTQPGQQPTQQKHEPGKQGGSGAGSGNKDGRLDEGQGAELRAQSSAQGAGYRVQGTENGELRAEVRAGQRAVGGGQKTEEKQKAIEVRVSAGTRNSISLDHHGAGLEQAAEAAVQGRRSLV